MKLPLRSQSGEDRGEIEVSDRVFAAEVNEALLHQVVVIYQNNQRQGTRSAKTRSEVRGGGRKPWRQKHTGRARQGSIRSPLWRKGGVVFGPRPLDFRLSVPQKMRRRAVVCALSAKARDGEIVVVEGLSLDEPKTKAMRQTLSALGGERALVVTADNEPTIYKSVRNLPGSATLEARQVTAHDLLAHPRVVLTAESVRVLEEVLG
jgi:large subunit ribosomal protein L4